MTKDCRVGYETIAKTLEILWTHSTPEERAHLSVRDVATELGLSKTTAHRALTMLTRYGAVIHYSGGGRPVLTDNYRPLATPRELPGLVAHYKAVPEYVADTLDALHALTG